MAVIRTRLPSFGRILVDVGSQLPHTSIGSVPVSSWSRKAARPYWKGYVELGKWNGASSGRPPFHLPRGLGQFHERGPHAVAQMIGCAVTALRKPHGQRPGAGS